MIPVTKPFLPPIEEYNKLVGEIWDRKHLTNNGPLVKQLENQLSEYLRVPNILFVNNGTIAIQIAIKALNLRGEIITTPFSYVATTSSIVWENCIPVFVDIDENSFNLDPALIEAAITDKTSAILATHVFGNPCEIDEIQRIANKHGLKVVYDAAHCFGTKYKSESVFNFGDVSTTSFHATKLFQTIEGGAVFSENTELNFRLSYMRNFGHNGPEDFFDVGINAKNSEFHAAMGICNLKYINEILESRKKQVLQYNFGLSNISEINTITIQRDSAWNYSYMPIRVSTENLREQLIDNLQKEGIYPRRYFYPSLNQLNYVYKKRMEISERISKTILCLPLFHDLKNDQINKISNIIKKTVVNR